MQKKAIVAGILSIISGASCLIGVAIAIVYIALLFFVISAANKQSLYGSRFPVEIFIVIIIGIAAFALAWALIGAFAVIGGVFALKAKRWTLALAGAIAGAAIFFPTGIAATVLISMARQEFSTAGAAQQIEAAAADSNKGSSGQKAKVSGILSIIAGVFGILFLGYAVLIMYMYSGIFKMQSMPGFPTEMYQFATVIYLVWGIVSAAMGIFAIVSGIFTLKQRHWGLALAGAIASTIVFYPCGIPAIILVALAKEEFSKQSAITASAPE